MELVNEVSLQKPAPQLHDTEFGEEEGQAKRKLRVFRASRPRARAPKKDKSKAKAMAEGGDGAAAGAPAAADRDPAAPRRPLAKKPRHVERDGGARAGQNRPAPGEYSSTRPEHERIP